jgi:hypothetical protein
MTMLKEEYGERILVRLRSYTKTVYTVCKWKSDAY